MSNEITKAPEATLATTATTAPLTRGAKAAADVTALLKARNTLLWIVTREEKRVEQALFEAAAEAKYTAQYWDCATGVSDVAGKAIDAQTQDPSAMLDKIRASATQTLYVMRDLHKWFDPIVLRKVRSLARFLQGTSNGRTIVVLTPQAEVPPELAGHAVVIDWPLPDRAEVAKILDDTLASIRNEEVRANACRNGKREAAIDAAVGLTAEEIANCFARSLVLTKTIDSILVANEKKRVIAREKVLTWYDPDPRGLEAIGGNDLLKTWLQQRKAAFSPKARAYGLPAPKGVFLVGLSGSGKSLAAKAVPTAYQMPLLRLDLGALMSKYVGDSQGNIRKALQVAEAIAPCVLWVDEVDKGLAGATGPQGDGGVASDQLGTLLTWQQERTVPVFLVMTANNIEGLPPELLRKGRFDDVFWLDLPTTKDRVEILQVALAEAAARATTTPEGGRPAPDLTAVAEATKGFAGAEVAQLVVDASFAAFADGERAITTQDLLDAAGNVYPLAKTAAEKITAMREWAKGRARPATSPEEEATGPNRALDLG